MTYFIQDKILHTFTLETWIKENYINEKTKEIVGSIIFRLLSVEYLLL